MRWVNPLLIPSQQCNRGCDADATATATALFSAASERKAREERAQRLEALTRQFDAEVGQFVALSDCIFCGEPASIPPIRSEGVLRRKMPQHCARGGLEINAPGSDIHDQSLTRRGNREILCLLQASLSFLQDGIARDCFAFLIAVEHRQQVCG